MAPILAPALEVCLDRIAAARYLNVSPATLAYWACSGKHRSLLRFAKFGKRCLYRREDLDRFLAAQFASAAQ